MRSGWRSNLCCGCYRVVVAAQLMSVTILFVITLPLSFLCCIGTWNWNKKPTTQIANTHAHAQHSCCCVVSLLLFSYWQMREKQATGYPVIWSFSFARLLVNLMLTTSIFTWHGWREKRRHDTMWTDRIIAVALKLMSIKVKRQCASLVPRASQFQGNFAARSSAIQYSTFCTHIAHAPHKYLFIYTSKLLHPISILLRFNQNTRTHTFPLNLTAHSVQEMLDT